MGHSPPREAAAPGGSRELVVLGTASQAPTRRRNHNGYLLRWDEEAYLFPDVIAVKDLDRIAIPARDEIQQDLGTGERSV